MKGRYTRQAVLLSGAVALLAVLTACKTEHVAAMKTYELITDYDRMSAVYEPGVSLVYVSPEAKKLGEYDTLVIRRVDMSRIWVERNEKTDVYRPFVAEQIGTALAKDQVFAKVVTDPAYLNVARPEEKVLVMDAVITRLESGNGTARFFLQTGATDFQIEGRVRDAATGRTVVEFVERCREIDKNPSQPSAKTLDADYALKRTIRKVATSVSRLLLDLSRTPASASKVAEQDSADTTVNPS
jgi:hypothetical protein